MIITSKTKVREMDKIGLLLDLSGVDILKEVGRFSFPSKLRGIKPMPFYDTPFTDLAWIWDTKDAEKLLIVIVEVFVYSQLPSWRKKLNKDSEQWARRWVLDCPLIDFYRFIKEIADQAKLAADQFSMMRVDLTKEEKQAGFGEPDPEAVMKMVDSFARRQGIPDLEVAGRYPWSIYRFVFQADIDNINKTRKLNNIINKQTPKK